MLPTLTPTTLHLEPGDDILLRHKTWQDYEDLLALRGDRAGARIRYNAIQQELRIMVPLPEHGKNADVLADVVKILLRFQGKDWEAYTPITLKCPHQQGIEPDYCFYIQHRDQVLGKRRIDLTIDPPPDLAIEIDLTSKTVVEDYQTIKAAELWLYRNDRLLIYQFDGQQYQDCPFSPQFPNIDLKTIIPQVVKRGWQVGSSVALREFEQALLRAYGSNES